jgi:ATP-dependent Lon protease
VIWAVAMTTAEKITAILAMTPRITLDAIVAQVGTTRENKRAGQRSGRRPTLVQRASGGEPN